MPKANIKMKYQDIGNFEFQSLMEKLVSTPTSNKNACMIRHVYNEAKRARTQISEEYKRDIMEAFAERDENGEIKRPEGDPGGFMPDPKRLEEFKKSQDDFGLREFVFEWGPLRPSHISDMKVSAKELNILGDLFNEDEGPGLPANVLDFPAQ